MKGHVCGGRMHAAMKVICLIVVGLLSAALCRPAQAQSDTFTQVGTWTCSVQNPSGGEKTFACPAISFPTAFGAPPNVVITACLDYSLSGANPPGECFGPDWITVQNVSAQSFGIALPSPLSSNTITATMGAQLVDTTLSGTWVATGPVLIPGTGVGTYLVLAVVYAPPGSAAAKGDSSVSYATGNTTGTTTSASQSFKQAYSVSVKASGGALGSGVSGGLSFGFSASSTNSQSLAIKKSVNSTINVSGPSLDGIYHDYDEIYLLLNPTINVDLSTSSANWTLASTQTAPIMVYVGCLNGDFPSASCDPGVQNALAAAGVTAADYPTILARDPLANGSTTPDPTRFALVGEYQYSPVPANAGSQSTNLMIQSSQITTLTSTAQDTYSVGVTWTATAAANLTTFLNVLSASMTKTGTFTFTNTSSQANSFGGTQSWSVTIGSPSAAYTSDNIWLDVYFDQIYQTFAFVLSPTQILAPSVGGTVVNAAGTPLARTEVILSANGINYPTFTNAKGEFFFSQNITGPATIQAGGVTQAVPPPQPQPARSVVIKVPAGGLNTGNTGTIDTSASGAVKK